MGKNLKKNRYAKPNHFAVHLKLTQRCKSTIHFLGLCWVFVAAPRLSLAMVVVVGATL